MTSTIIQVIQQAIEGIDPKNEQSELADNFFQFAELLETGELYDLVMDAYLLARYGEYEAHGQPCTKDQLLLRWRTAIHKN